MTIEHQVPDPWDGNSGRAQWMPPQAFSNGLGARAWTVLADLREHEVYPVLFALSDVGIAGYVTVARVTPMQRGDQPFGWRLRVDARMRTRAEDALMVLLRGPLPEYPPSQFD